VWINLNGNFLMSCDFESIEYSRVYFYEATQDGGDISGYLQATQNWHCSWRPGDEVRGELEDTTLFVFVSDVQSTFERV
jgi:hypothetical protein